MLKLLWISLVVLILDQITKAAATANLEMWTPVEVMPYFNFMLAHNTGAAFSFLADSGGWQRWFFTIIATVVSIAIIVWIKKLKPEEKTLGISLSLILGGAIGNLVDRVRFGYVVDFIDVYVGTAHWPAFNVADSAICVGAAIMIITSFRQPHNAEQDDEKKKTQKKD